MAKFNKKDCFRSPKHRVLQFIIKYAYAVRTRSGLYGVLMILDLDNFKPLNDKHGHDVSDLSIWRLQRLLQARAGSCFRVERQSHPSLQPHCSVTLHPPRPLR
ncbi:diguanylate cyclase domain-containing protein [Sulfuricella denitrificans]|uniref:diguanylate cyclase domain-containing protein n=1 Tax=Sulfuricella denitrificans TaxID=649841 RepID=UPI000A0526BB